MTPKPDGVFCTARMHGWAPNRDHQIEDGQWCLCRGRQWYSRLSPVAQGVEYQIAVHRGDAPDIVYPVNDLMHGVTVAHEVIETIVGANDEDRHPVQIELRSRMVGTWEAEAGYTVGIMAPPGWEVRYTNANDRYFGFGTHVLKKLGTHAKNSDSEFVAVAIDKRHLEWQTDRNASGLYLTLTERAYNQRRIDGSIIPI